MDDNFDTCLAFTLQEEGGYSDNPADPGGATNMGITLATYRQWSDNPNLGPVQVQDMTERWRGRSIGRCTGTRFGRTRCPSASI